MTPVISTGLTSLSSQVSQQRSAFGSEAMNSLNELQRTVSQLHSKVQQLKHSRSDDPIQQQQTEAIVELFHAVAWIQRILWPTVEQLMLGGVNTDAVRDAAGGGGGGSGASASASALSASIAQAGMLRRP